MSYKGFDNAGILLMGSILSIRWLLEEKSQLNLEKEMQITRIVSVLVHVAQAIEVIKNYRILPTTYPLIMRAGLYKI